MPSSPSVVFNSHPSTPIFYQSAINTYRLCPSCFRQRETRFCSGRSELSWELCEKHEQRTSSGKKTTLYDPDDLTFFREALLDGRLTDHFHFKMGTLSDNGTQEDLTFRNPSYFKPASNPKTKRTVDDKDRSDSESNTKKDDKDVAASGEKAVPMLNGGSSDTSSDHIPSASSTTITSIVRKALSAEVSRSGQDSRKQPRRDSSASNITPSRRISSPPVQATQMRRAIAPFARGRPTPNVSPTIHVRYAHDPKRGCIYSSAPSTHIIDHHVIRATNRQKLHHLQLLREQYDAGWGTDPDLKYLHTQILQNLQTSSLAKGVYLKRCNGEYVNGIGETVNLDVILNMTEESLKRLIKDSHRRRDEYFSTKLQEWTRQIMLNEDDLRIQDDQDSGYASPSSNMDATHSTPSSEAPQGQEHDPLVHMAASCDKQDRGTGDGEPTPGALLCRNKFDKIANHSPDEISIPDDLSDTSGAPKDEAAYLIRVNDMMNNVVLKRPQVPEMEGVTLLWDLEKNVDGIEPKIQLAMLLAREEQVREGRASEEDLVVTCWAVNSQKDSK